MSGWSDIRHYGWIRKSSQFMANWFHCKLVCAWKQSTKWIHRPYGVYTIWKMLMKLCVTSKANQHKMVNVHTNGKLSFVKETSRMKKSFHFSQISKDVCCKGWTGASCNVAVCTVPCKNGQCIKPDQCLCNSGYAGEGCQYQQSESDSTLTRFYTWISKRISCQ